MFSKSTSYYQTYIDLGKKGVTLSECYSHLPPFLRKNTKLGHPYFGDMYVVQYFAFGLVESGYLDNLFEFYNVSASLAPEGIHYADKILEYGMRAALHHCDLYLYEEVKNMHYDPAKIENKLKANIHPDEENKIKHQLKKLDELKKQVKPPYELIKAINKELKNIIWHDVYIDEKPHNCERWVNNKSRYPDKYHVLIELKKYLFGASTIDKLSEVIAANPKYDKIWFKNLFFKHSETGKLLEKALLVKGESLTTPQKNHLRHSAPW